MIEPVYRASDSRYQVDGMPYRRCGCSGVLLPAISLGLWQNFGSTVPFERSKAIMHYAFDHGVTHFDLANNYGPEYGTAEETFGRMMQRSFAPYRDELFISTKAAYDMWPGPYGIGGSRKHLMASLDQSLRRMKLDYVDIFYIHRYDPTTPLTETLRTLVDMVRSGKTLYVGISRWPKDALTFGLEYLKAHECPCLLLQDRLNLLDRQVMESGCLELAHNEGSGFVAFSPLAQGLLTDRYLHGVPADSRAARGAHLTTAALTPQLLQKLSELDRMARQRGQTLAQMALSWILSHEAVTSVLVGASSVEQLEANLKAAENTVFSDDERRLLDAL
ncbi:MAG: aldo/keto reductase [Muribaculaceae bacterium]|nr:aldo/keto reductase [Muribaculaceae bacterium]